MLPTDLFDLALQPRMVLVQRTPRGWRCDRRELVQAEEPVCQHLLVQAHSFNLLLLAGFGFFFGKGKEKRVRAWWWWERARSGLLFDVCLFCEVGEQ